METQKRAEVKVQKLPPVKLRDDRPTVLPQRLGNYLGNGCRQVRVCPTLDDYDRGWSH